MSDRPDLRRARKQMVEMPAPARRILTLAVANGRGMAEDRFDPLPHTTGSFRFLDPNWPKRRERLPRSNPAHVEFAVQRKGLALQRRLPLSRMFFIFPSVEFRVDCPRCRVPKRQFHLTLSFGQRVQPISDKPSCIKSSHSGDRQGDSRPRDEPHISPAPIDLVSQYPRPRPVGFDQQHQLTPVAIATTLCSFNLLGRQRQMGSHIRPRL